MKTSPFHQCPACQGWTWRYRRVQPDTPWPWTDSPILSGWPWKTGYLGNCADCGHGYYCVEPALLGKHAPEIPETGVLLYRWSSDGTGTTLARSFKRLRTY
jgi:hypothetical protein